MSVVVVLGLQWGDEGKGKIIDWLSSQADVVARYQGGNNAGHTVIVGDKQYILHLIPSGIIHDKPMCLIGNGVVINPVELKKEIDKMEAAGIKVNGRLFVSENAHCLMPYHIKMDQLQEQKRGKSKIGTTGRGIGSCYGDKTTRHGIRFCEVLNPARWDFSIARVMEFHNEYLKTLDPDFQITESDMRETLAQYKELMEPYVIDGVSYVNDALNNGQRVMAEGAQGIMLDVDFGTYPFVTSSNPSTGGVCTGLGIPPMAIKRVVGVAKAYTTRVGAGPFPTEFDEEFGEKVRELGGEYGATTGRPRRCGWLDIALLRRTLQITGTTDIIVTKLDVLDTLDEISICTGYKVNGEPYSIFPFGLTDDDVVEPILETMPGWKTSLCDARSVDELPKEALDYVKRIEELCKAHVTAVSVGADRVQTILTREISFFDM